VTYSFADILFVDFPLSDASGTKIRPALVILDSGDADVLVARVSGQDPRSRFDIVLKNWQEANLMLPSIVRSDKLATIDKRFVRRSLGILSAVDKVNLKRSLFILWKTL
jgi:mRNA interferase MazF